MSFAEYHLFYRALLHKRPTILRSLLIVATPYVYTYKNYALYTYSRRVSLTCIHIARVHITHTYLHITYICIMYASCMKIQNVHSYHTIVMIHVQSYHMGWLRSVGSIKLRVSFTEYCLFYRALLRKRPVIQSILLTKATLYHIISLQSNPMLSHHYNHIIRCCTSFL